MRIPVPLLGKPVGAGDAAKALTSALGIKPCGGCKERAEKMNKRVMFAPMTKPAKIPANAVPMKRIV